MDNVKHSSPTLVIVGDNFISNSLFNDYIRYGKFKVKLSTNMSNIKEKVDIIIDCSFNERIQNVSLTFARVNKLEKILLINHWERKKLPQIDTIILQAVLYDVYGTDHNSFHRQGPGNNYETDIKYCTLIGEAIRRIHEAKLGGVPNVYIPYGELKIRFSYIDNIYEPINHMIALKKDSCYAIYDEEKYVSAVIGSIQKVLDYRGNVIIQNDNSIYTQRVTNLDYHSKKRPNNIEHTVRRIYNYLKFNNPRFMLD